MKENYKIVIVTFIAVVLIMFVVAAAICLPNMDHSISGVFRSNGMNIFGGRRW